MALIKCPECGKEFSEFSNNCPNCGIPTGKIKLIVCSDCGAKNRDIANFCKRCGLDFAKQRAEKQEAEKQEAEKQEEARRREEVEKKKHENMVLIPAGEFTMGSDEGGGDEKPVHRVYLDAYYIDKHQVTFEQYDKFCEATGRTKPSDSGWGRGNRPVINVSWDNAVAYAEWAGKRLPTEAEWEKACRAGSTGKYCYGDSKRELGEYAWYSSDPESKTHPVGQKKPNAWGLYDMHGNVWEWCSDWYDSGYYSKSPSNNPEGPGGGRYRVLRGGSWDYNAGFCRSTIRGWSAPVGRLNGGGFRCAVGVVQGR